jgi:hypothetical protein
MTTTNGKSESIFMIRYLRIILLADAVTVHNAFFDRRFKEK